MPRTKTGQFRPATPWEQAKQERRERREAQRAVVEGRRIANRMAMADVAAAARAAHGRTA